MRASQILANWLTKGWLLYLEACKRFNDVLNSRLLTFSSSTNNVIKQLSFFLQTKYQTTIVKYISYFVPRQKFDLLTVLFCPHFKNIVSCLLYILTCSYITAHLVLLPFHCQPFVHVNYNNEHIWLRQKSIILLPLADSPTHSLVSFSAIKVTKYTV